MTDIRVIWTYTYISGLFNKAIKPMLYAYVIYAFGLVLDDDQCNSTATNSGVRCDGKCGYNFNDAKCSTDNCCSIYGFCGNTDGHCEPATCVFQCRNAGVLLPDKSNNICTDISLSIQPALSTKLDSQGVSFPAYRNYKGILRFSVRFAEDCVDSTEIYVKVTVEAQDENGMVFELAQSTASTVKTPFQFAHQGGEDNWFPGTTDSFFWYHTYVCLDPDCVTVDCDFISETYYVGSF